MLCNQRRLIRLVLVALTLCTTLPAAGTSQERPQITKTERFDFAAHGALIFKGTKGELTIQGWDRPAIELTTNVRAADGYTGAKGQKIGKEMSEIHITAERNGDTVVIATQSSRRRAFPAIGPGPKFTVEYIVRAPADSRLAIEQKSGGIHIEDMIGPINAAAGSGEVTILLPESAKFSVDARSFFGAIVSDFPGTRKANPWLTGQRLRPVRGDHPDSLIRVIYGDILILKKRVPPTPPPTKVDR